MENFFGCGAKRNDDCFAVLCGDGGAQPISDMNQPANKKGAQANGNQARAEGEAFLVRVIQDWSRGDVNTSSHCIDVHEGELIVVIRKGSHGWFFGRVLHDAKGWPTEFGNQGWFPPSFTREVAVSENQTKIGNEILQNSRGRQKTSFPVARVRYHGVASQVLRVRGRPAGLVEFTYKKPFFFIIQAVPGLRLFGFDPASWPATSRKLTSKLSTRFCSTPSTVTPF